MQLHQLILLAATALPACEVPSVSSKDRADVSAEAVSVGKFADATLGDLETRARAAGWKVMASESDSDPPVPNMALELDDGSHFAYVTVFDFARTKTVASKLGSHTALALEAERDADRVLLQLIGKSGLDDSNRNSLKTSCENLGYKVMYFDAIEEDGVTFVTISAVGRDDNDIELFFMDFAAAKNEGRIGVDGHRIMNVFVCKDCTKRNTRILSQAWQTAKAKVLLGRLTRH